MARRCGRTPGAPRHGGPADRARRLLAPLLVLVLAAGCGRQPVGDAPAAAAGADADPVERIARLRDAAAGRNLLVVLLDAAAAEHLGCYGYARDTTPHLDRVAAESILFENAYAQASGTMTSVFSFFTSRYPVFGDDLRMDGRTILTIPPELTTMAEFMARRYPQRLGYTSNIWLKRELGHGRGFTAYVESWRGSLDDPAAPTDDLRFLATVDAWLAARADEGFFAYLHLMKPHEPYDPPEPFRSRFAAADLDTALCARNALARWGNARPPERVVRDAVALYDGNLACIDDAVGRLIGRLQERGLWDRTVFVLMADHGEALYEHGGVHGHSRRVYEEMIRVPLLLRIPGAEGTAGRRVATPVELVDLLPTLLDLLAVEHAGEVLAGRSLLPAAAGAPLAPRDVHSRTDRREPATFCLRRGDHKLVLWRGKRPKRALYDLSTAAGETRNLLREGERSPRADELAAALRDWLAGGGRQGSVAGTLDLETLDAEEIARLRSLGYVR